MKDLIEALQIFAKYIPAFDDSSWTACDHDVLYVCCPEELVSEEDVRRLEELSFILNEDDGGFMSFRFGSC
jgi:hypothetical protein